MGEHLRFNPTAALAPWARVLPRADLDAIADRVTFAAVAYDDAGLALADLLVGATDAVNEPDGKVRGFALLSVADALADAMLREWGAR